MPLQNGRRSSNSEGYPDPTVAQAFSNIDTERAIDALGKRKPHSGILREKDTPADSFGKFVKGYSADSNLTQPKKPKQQPKPSVPTDESLKKARKLYAICTSIMALEGCTIEDITLKFKGGYRVTQEELNPHPVQERSGEVIAERISRKEGFDRT